MLLCRQVPSDIVPMALLLEADPSEIAINKYLNNSICYVAEKSGEIVAVCVLNALKDKSIELFNIAVIPKEQGQGVGSALLRFVIGSMKARGITRIELGTGTFGYQLAFYQRLSFRVDSVIKNFFIDNYDEPIFEHGLQHKDMLRLVLEL